MTAEADDVVWHLRLELAETGGDVAAVDWDAYYPAPSAYYRELFS